MLNHQYINTMTKKQCKELRKFVQRFKVEKPLYTLQFEPLTFEPYTYGKALTDFIKSMYEEKLIISDYSKVQNLYFKSKNTKKFITKLNEEDCLSLLTAFIRQNRFIDGLLAGEVEDGTVELIVDRLENLIDS